ncbi:MAG: hypothetical protein L6R40_008605 [Gallowayella cf. fulva]|nr:MAG: hypothetical protein L6R40_008605 [Xanthomendoza cf. fulva]
MPSPAALGAVNGHDSNGKSKANDSVSPQSKEEKEALLAKVIIQGHIQQWRQS